MNYGIMGRGTAICRLVRIQHRIAAALLCVILMLSCNGRGRLTGYGNGLSDSLCVSASALLPVSLDSAQATAERALAFSGKGSSARVVAQNTLGDIAFARMNYVEASERYLSVLNGSRNRVEWLWADVGMMNICQRISDNMSFYQYRDMALRELRSIRDESSALPEAAAYRAWAAETDLRLVSATYFFTVQQDSSALAELSKVENNALLRSDTLRYLRWNSLRSTDLASGKRTSVSLSEGVRYLFGVHEMAVRNGYIGQSALTLQRIARVIMEADDAEFFGMEAGLARAVNPSGLSRLLLVRQLSLVALQQFLKYDSGFGVAETYCQLGECANGMGEFREALQWLAHSLEMFNTARDMALTEVVENVPYLETYRQDTIVAENVWIENIPLTAVPECMSRVREQMSLAYSGLGDKTASDYNRNVYLELQKTIRLDRRYEARQQHLRVMNRSLNIALVTVVILLILMAVAVVLFVRAVNRRGRAYTDMMRRVMDVCGGILSARPADGESMTQCLSRLLNDGLASVVGADSIEIQIQDDHSVTLVAQGDRPVRDARSLLDSVAPYVEAAIQNADVMADINDRHILADKEHYLAQMHTEENRRQNLVRRTCCTVMNDCIPLIERMVGETSRLIPGNSGNERHLEYISELARRTGQYGEALTRWARISQGEVSFHIENFELQPLFDILRRSERSFTQKGIRLEVCDTDAVVKADRVLTLFMLNTLADNSRKFTPSGGTVTVQAEEGDGWVELSVSDTGIGLSEEDVRRLTEEKVYNPQQIGVGTVLEKSKGSGFGLMNCRGIIGKYQKCGELFSCCRFDVKSTPGQGSRFSFRLPKGIRRALALMLLFVSVLTAGASASASDPTLEAGSPTDDAMLHLAYEYADSVYECNLNGEYERAVEYAGIALDILSADYCQLTGDSTCAMEIAGDGIPAEQKWQEKGFATDYETILWIRNELAVAALALQDMEMYRYNDDAYLTLFRLFFREDSIERDCVQLQRSNSNLRTAIVLSVLLIVGIVLFHLVLRSRHWLRYRSDLRQILSVTGNITSVLSDAVGHGEYNLQQMADNLIDTVFPDLQIVAQARFAGITLSGAGQSCQTSRGDVRVRWEGREFPLKADSEEGDVVVGSMIVSLRRDADEADIMACRIISEYMASAVHNCVLRLSSGYRSVEQLREDSERLTFENNRIHVQNMVIDNCLSTLRHETLSYPSRIEQLAVAVRNGGDGESIADLRELTLYYSEIYDILCRNVRRQVEGDVCHIGNVSTRAVLEKVKQTFDRAAEGKLQLALPVDNVPECRADSVLLGLLLENLTLESLRYPSPGELGVSVVVDGDFVRMELTDNRPDIPTDNIEMMFTPLWQENNLRYSVCRQIIRELDEAMGHPGCRINAEANLEAGVTIWFTLPGTDL